MTTKPYEDREEVRVNGKEYSVYCNSDTDYNVQRKGTCPDCGKDVKFCPTQEIELVEVVDAELMIQITPDQTLAEKLKREIKREKNMWYRKCEDCMKEVGDE